MNLKTYIQETKMKKETILKSNILEWSIQLFEALDYMHKPDPNSNKLIVHRNINPSYKFFLNSFILS